jgi:ABC-type multidrug transport system fused ATPase/permease subunit
MIALDSLRGKVTIATQQPLLFDLSIRENITYGLKNISPDKVEEVSRAVCIDDFIKQLSLGYDTMIGEDAFRLSQGFKQRVAIARAILRDPQLLILDEATSSVDFLTEEKIFKNLKSYREGKTTLIISHRLLSIKDADKIYFLKQDGQMAEGSHCELFSRYREYKDFFHNQTENT